MLSSRPAWRIAEAVYDTSALMLLAEGVPVFELVEEVLGAKPRCVVLPQVLEELERHASSRSVRKRVAARLAIQIVSKRGCVTPNFRAGRLADDAIVEYVRRNIHAIAVTADTGLHRRLLQLGIPHLYYREEGRRFEAAGV
ncbi:hypothetical protein Pyrfu_1573 [Pyrolobus fumarii 1A]|uniref:VapC9 PIN-like domain-containing protein n=1 Tax=Pyrolobus fumarii (strain DSM 11204 / 1A) TaxID=694429 RepID=G0EC60_PYRF1|nr:PIN domain-containing protein [Pyrolobus fumarii]AEM39430.1 hypothetical protein Pyrfu_1573 [Pyrolobus fumarii 1A]